MYPLIDIHTHRKEPDAAALRSIRLGTDAVPSDGSLFSAGIHPWDSEKPIRKDCGSSKRALRGDRRNRARLRRIGRPNGTTRMAGSATGDRPQTRAAGYLALCQSLQRNAADPAPVRHTGRFPRIRRIETTGRTGVESGILPVVRRNGIPFFENGGRAAQYPIRPSFPRNGRKRGRIGSIYERAAAIRGVSVAELAAEIRKNYRKIFAA